MTRKIFLFSLVLLAISFNAYAQDSSRITQLEQDIQAIKQRLSKLESPQGSSIEVPRNTNNDGWKSQSSWRLLTTGMTPNEVKKILGEPSRVNGGEIATWYYQNRGYVTFMSDKLYSWGEPK